MTRPIGRRDFLRTAATISACAMTGVAPSFADDKKPRLKKAVKYGMVQLKGGSHHDRLALARKCGFLGVEIDSPGTAHLDELVKASRELDVAIHGVIDSVHWKDTLSSPDEKVRAKGLEALIGALADAKTVGAHNFKAGIYWEWNQKIERSGDNAPGTYSFSGADDPSCGVNRSEMASGVSSAG